MKKVSTILLMLWSLVLILPQAANASPKSFAAGSIIVPMDPCWQPNRDKAVDSTFLHSSCDTNPNDRGLFQAYGMVYSLVRQGVRVYWTIDAQKTSRNAIDFTINGDPKAPVKKYASGALIDPSARTVDGEDLGAHVIEYRGGPFVINVKDLNSKARDLLDSYGNVKKHVAMVDFSAPVEKVLADMPPKIAVLGQGATDVLRDYLIMSGLGYQSNLVYDIVQPAQIIDGTLADDYQLFWAPHWIVEDEVKSQEQRDKVMAGLRDFLEAGNSAFLECASLESVEGSPRGGVDQSTQKYGGWLTNKDWDIPRIETNAGGQDRKYVVFEDHGSFLTQCASWIYDPKGGHVHNFRPDQEIPYWYNDSVTRFVHDEDGAFPPGNPNIPGFDYYVGGRINGSPTQGFVSYLAGHKYGKCQGRTAEGETGSDFVLDLKLKKAVNNGDYVDLTLHYGEDETLKARYYVDETVVALDDAILEDKQVHDQVFGIEFKDASWAENQDIKDVLIVNRTTSAQQITKISIAYPPNAGELKELQDENQVTGSESLCKNLKGNPATCSVNYSLPGAEIESADVSSCKPVWGNTNTCGMRYVLNTVLGLQFTLVSNEFVEASPILDGDLTFKASFEFPGHLGHLRAIRLGATIDEAVEIWDAGEKIPLPGVGGSPGTWSNSDPPTAPSRNGTYRYIFTNDKSFNDLTFGVADDATLGTLKKLLKVSTDNEAKMWINTVRGRTGASPADPDGRGDAAHRLWGITDSTPAVIKGSPIIGSQKTRDRIIYAGAEDGMLHAFFGGSWNPGEKTYDEGTGREIWAYIPGTLIPYLKEQPFTESDVPAKVNVDGSPAVGDYFIDLDGNGINDWHTLLVGTATVQGLNQGVVFALDITNPYQPDLLWEYTYPDDNMGNSKGVAIGSVKDGDSIQNYVFLTASYKEKIAGKYGINAFAFNLADGTKKWQFSADYPSPAQGRNETPAIPSLMDYGNNGDNDFLVFGDMAGRLWALDVLTGESIKKDNKKNPVAVYEAPGGTDEPIGAGVAIKDDKVVFGTGGADVASDDRAYGIYAVEISPTGATEVWSMATEVGEKVWARPTIDRFGNVFMNTARGYSRGLSPDSQGDTSGRILVLDHNSGSLERSIDIENAGLGNVEVGNGGAVAVSFNGEMIQVGTPVDGEDGPGKTPAMSIFSWRLR